MPILGGTPTDKSDIFSQKLHVEVGVRTFWSVGGGGRRGRPPWIRHCLVMSTLHFKAKVDPPLLCAMDSSDSPLGMTPAHLLVGRRAVFDPHTCTFVQTQVGLV